MSKKLLVILSMILGLTVITFSTLNSNADEDREKELGTAINAVSIPGAAYGQGPDGENYVYAVAGGSPGKFNVVNADTGDLVDSFDLEGASSSWGVTVDPDGNAYVGTYSNAGLYRYVPGSGELEHLGNIPGESFIWRIASDSDGNIYSGTYPNAKVVKYDPDTDEFHDYGSMVEGQQYARSIDIYKDKAYVGVGTNGPNLVELDLKTGEKTIIDLPEKFDDQTNVYDMDVVRNKLFARVTGVATTLVYDLKTMEIVDEIEGVDGLDISPAGPKNNVYMVRGGKLHEYNLNSLELTDTGVDFPRARGFGWFEFDTKEFPGKTLVTTEWNGNINKYNPITGNVEVTPGQIAGEPVDIQSLAQGPDGNIYVGGYFSGGLAQYDVEEDKLTEFKGMGQIEGMTTHQDNLYMGVYTGAEIFSYDPSQPYEYGTNPQKVFDLKDQEQDRPFALTSVGDLLAVGTIPDYGKLGGVLALYDPSTDEYTSERHVVQNQSIASLASKDDDIVYGGTTVWGGLGIEPTEENAKLFAYDVNTKEKLYEMTPIEGEKAITSLTFDDEGYLWGLTSGKVFKFDVESQQVVESVELYPMNWDSVSHSWRGGFISFNDDGQIYGQTHGEVFKLNPETLEHETLAEDALLFAQDNYGDVYFARDYKLFKYITE
ncbi:WD40 repeat domain-containing protein [Aquisalibacillus elongatus]|uniref:Streptogramin lyase n=1 Tax=Aquisalibacillus elongatus TaxID=485577 RepID=A0A3N5BA61_9BACI|nr:WD40 repeat domain-containing protein [Aquisalibacillus elongatus]RPF54293.1 hypothetical protein EDC24_1490 [Aquisalibacillus elongatus]